MIIDHCMITHDTVINNHLLRIYELTKHWSILYYYIICKNSAYHTKLLSTEAIPFLSKRND